MRNAVLGYEERGMDSLTMAVAIPVSTDQSHAPVSSDRIDPESQSFAKSFDEGVALQAIADTNPSAPQGLAELPNAEKGSALTMSGESAASSSVMKSRAIATKPVIPAANSGAKITNGTPDATSLNSPATVTDSLRAGAPFGKVLADAKGKIQSVANTGAVVAKTPSSREAVKAAANTNVLQAERPAGKPNQTADEISDGQEAVLPAGTEDDISISQVRLAVKDVRSVSSGNALGKTEPVADTKTAKSQESKGRYKGTLNGLSKSKNVTNKVTNVSKAPEDQTIAATIVAVAVSATVQQGGMSSVTSGPADVTPPANGQITGAPITAAKSGKVSAHPQKTAVNDPLPTVQTAPDEASSSNAASALAMTAPSVAAAESDGKIQRAAITATTHATTAPELVGSIALTHGTEAAGGTKLQAVDVSTQIAAGHVAHDATGSMTPADAAHSTLMATPTALEVGIASGTHGWLKIRAEMAGSGVVNASLSGASPAAQEMLHRELPSLTAYLQQEQVAINTVVVHPMIAGAELRSLVGNMGGNAGGPAQHGSRQGGAGTQATVATSVDEVASGGVGAVGVDGLLSPAYAAGGRWLSVRA